ncbi:putative COP9 signalosome complex subunit 7 [Monocercomonoides exilis]|uniref:putative COP9 signalosome complex subunit 7 n=1 Tax=Monocercomonoides exilis TaxID=2049356 RepID=UPI00355A7CD0|nr:putative COP9 signalosome complex subunit 7 [Monocercomonoides exilis]|eukprot:MONOS_12051.1-p1 / transcript=MONOS_12051.1 / gene=MONOS_12051 / organism=Monocercomonoides_exilis_PA203 / gene_product=GA15197 / transcript_product=GA15197 / location=Mono_scaffold00640:3976-4800(+) / protein_length=239 / sequence_SO=supercontig / SO=protein_coding / is_pseudo=false
MDGGVSQLLEFVKQCEGKSGNALEPIIKGALEHPAIYVFSELTHCPPVEAFIESKANEKLINTLELFSYGVYLEYKNNSNKYIPLNDEMTIKLKHLTILTLCRDTRSISYKTIQSETDTPDLGKMETLVIDSIYRGIVRGKLDHDKQCFHVEASAPRDVPSERIPIMIEKLEEWLKQLESADDTIRQQLNHLNSEKDSRLFHSEKMKELYARKKEHIQQSILSSIDQSDDMPGMMRMFS